MRQFEAEKPAPTSAVSNGLFYDIEAAASWDEYASSENNDIHANNHKCRVGLLKRWLKKYTIVRNDIRNHTSSRSSSCIAITTVASTAGSWPR